MQRRRMRGASRGLVVVMVVAGGALVALPWVPWQRPLAWPARWGPDSDVFADVVRAAAAVDAACQAGDTAALARATTRSYLAEIEALLARDGRRLDAETLRQQKVLVGAVAPAALVLGVAGEGVAVAVLARDRAGFEHGAEARGLLALRFVRDGHAVRLDRKAWRTLPPGEAAGDAARALAHDVLAAR